MSLVITNECINCGVCEDVCPNNAISDGEKHKVINSHLCNECAGFNDEPRCIDICPVEAIDYGWAINKKQRSFS